VLSVSIGPSTSTVLKSICLRLAAVVVRAAVCNDSLTLNSSLTSLYGSDDKESFALDSPPIEVAVVVVATGFV